MKVLTDLVIVLMLRAYRHSGPLGPGVHPANPAHPGHPASDAETQEHREKGLEDLNVYRTSEQSGEKVQRTLIALDTLEPIVFGGEGLSSCLSCASWPSCFRRGENTAGDRPPHYGGPGGAPP